MECLNCHTDFIGNYCPSCGQPASTKRFTIKNTLMSTLEVWGMGNRSLPRTIFQLFTRPGKMIGEYLDGKRIPYFPPVKMLFVLCIFISGETMLIGRTTVKDEVEKENWMGNDNKGNPKANEEMNHTIIEIFGIKVTPGSALNGIKSTIKWFDEHKAIELICLHSFFMFATWRVFRKAPLRPKTTLAENFYSQVLISSQMVALSILYLPFANNEVYTFYPLPSLVLFALLVWDYKQLFGFPWRKTIRLTIVMHILCFFAFIILLSITIGVVGMITGLFEKMIQIHN